MTVRLKRWIWRITTAAAVFLLLFLLLHTPPAKWLVSTLITTTVSWLANAEFSIGNLDYRLWNGEVAVESMSYLDTEGSARIEVRVPRGEVSIAPSFELKAVAHQPHVLVSIQENEEEGEKGDALDWSFFDYIPSVEVRGGAVEVAEEDAWRIAIADVNALGDERQGRYAIDLDAGGATIRFAKGEVVLDSLHGEGAVVEGELVLDRFRLVSGDSSVEGKGSSDRVNPFSGAVDLGFELDALILRSWFPEAEMRGVMSGDGSFAYRDNAFIADGAFESGSLQWADLEPWAAEGRIALVDNELGLDDTILRGYDGRVDVEARMALGEEALQSFRVRYSGLRTVPFIDDVFPGFPALSASIHGEASLELRDWSFEPGDWSASAVAEPESSPDTVPVGGILKATGDGNHVEIEADLGSEPLQSTMELRGRVGTDRVDVTVEQRWNRLEETLAWLTERDFLPEQLPDFHGSLRSSGKVGGTLDEPKWVATLESSGLRIGGLPHELIALLSGDWYAARIEDLTLHGSQGQLTAKGAFPLSDRGEWDLDVRLSGMPSSHLIRDFDIDLPGELGGEGRVVGLATDPDWSFALRHHSEGLLADGVGEAELSVWKEKRSVRYTARASSGEASIDGSGSYSLDAESIEARLTLANLSLGGLTSIVTDLEGFAGSLSGELEAHGTLESPVLRANLTVPNGSFREHEIQPVQLSLASDGVELELSLDLGGERLARGRGRLEESYPFSVEADLSRFPFTALVQGLTGRDLEVALNGNLELDMALSQPEDLRYRASIEEYQAILPQVIQQASDFTIEGGLRALTIHDFRSVAENRTLSLQGVIPLRSEEDFDFDVAGDLDLSVIGPLLEKAELDGRAAAQFKVSGTLSAPELTGTLEVHANAGKWNGLEWEGIELQARAERRRLFVDTATLRALGGVVSFQGEVPIRDTEPGRFSFSLQEIDLGRLFSEAAENSSLVVSADGALDVGELSIEGVRGSGRITSVVAGVGNQEIRNSEPTLWRFEQGAFSTDRLRLVGGASDLAMEIGPVHFGEELLWQTWVRGKVGLSVLSPFLSSVPGMQIAGNADLDFRLKDGPDGFVAEGRGAVSGGRFVIPQPPIVLADLEGTLTLDATGVRLRDLSARVGDGRVEGEGHIDLTDRSQPALDFKMQAEAVPLQLAEGLRGRVSGTLQFAGQEDFTLSGRVKMDRGIFDRELGQEDRLMSEPMVIYGLATEASFLDRVALAIDVETVSDLRVENSLANLEAGANIALRGTLEAPVVNGIVLLRSDGRFNIGRNRLTITSGRITFEDYPGETPRIQLSAFTRVSTTTIHLDLDGTMNDIQTRLSAPDDPSLSEGDLTSLLVTGRTLENAAEGGTQIASTWMMSSMANLLHEGWGDLFTFGAPPGAGPLSLGEEANPTSRLTLGRGITDRLSLTYSIALDQTESQLWILDYRVARNLWIQAIQENGNEYTLGFTHRLLLGQKKPETAGTSTEARIISGVSYRTELTGKVAELSKQVKTKAGDTYDYWAASEDAQRLRDTLVREGYRSAVVEVSTSPDEERIALTFKIEAGPPLEIVWEGDDPGGDLKKKIEAAWNGRVPIEFLVPDLAARATWELRSKRYYTAQVKGTVEPSEESHRVVFHCVLGRQGREVLLSFDGNQNLNDLALAAALPETRTPEFFALLEKPDELAKGVLLRYASEGYLDASAEIGETSYDPDANVLKVAINVDEGPIIRISDLEFDGVDALPVEALSRAIDVTEGQAIDVEAIRAAQTALLTFYRDSGFADATVKSWLTRSSEGIEVLFRVDEGAQARVGSVHILGTSRVRESVIQNQLTFREGDTLRVSALNKSMKNLYDSGVFRSADVRVDSESSDEDVKDVLVQVAERTGFDMSYGLRYNFVPEGQNEGNLEAKVEGLEGVIRASVANPWGYGSTLGVYTFVQDGRSLFRGYDRFPLFLGRRLPTDLVVELEDDQSLPGFSIKQWNFTFQQTKRLRDNKFSVQWNVRVGRGHFQGVVGEDGQSFDVNEYRTQLGTSLIYDQRDSMAHPSRGKFWNLTVQVAPEALGSETAYYRFFGQLFNFHPLFGSVVWASSYRVGLAQGTREVLIIEDRFKAGGANSVRGFAQNSLGPTVKVPDIEEEVFIGGQAVVVMNQELRFPLWKALHGAVFYDMGNVFPRVKDMSFSEIRHTAGAGLRYTMSFGAIRLDWARILDVQTGEQPSRFHFGFGYAF